MTYWRGLLEAKELLCIATFKDRFYQGIREVVTEAGDV